MRIVTKIKLTTGFKSYNTINPTNFDNFASCSIQFRKIKNPDKMKIDVAEVVRLKAPNKKIPKFIVNYLKRIVHEDELNVILTDFADLRNLEFIDATLKHLGITSSLKGKENLPHGGKYIFVSNHPLGGLDGLTIGNLIGKEYENKVRFFSNDILVNLKPIKEMFIPVNKVGQQSKDHALMLQQFYESENHLITFPAGMCSRKINGKITDLEWKKNFITKSVQYKRDVIPLYFEGRNSGFFYNLANFRKFLKIKFNIEMMYLSDELFKQRGKNFTVRVGKPIPWQTFDKSKSHTEWAEWVKELVYKMA